MGKRAGHLIEEVGTGVFHFRFWGKMGAGIEDHGEVEGRGFFVDGHGAGVGGMKILGRGTNAEAFEVQFFSGVDDLIDGVILRGIDAGETNHPVGVFFAVVGDVFVWDLGT